MPITELLAAIRQCYSYYLRLTVLQLLPQTVICFPLKPHGNLTTKATKCDSVTEQHEFKLMHSL